MALMNLEAVRDWFNGQFKLKTDDLMASVLTLSFDASLIGETWTVTDGGTEIHTGTVDSSLTAEVRIGKLETTYTITCGVVEKIIVTGMYYMPYSDSVIPYSIANTLPGTTEQNVITFATIQNFDTESPRQWGDRAKPVTAAADISKNPSGDAVRLDNYSKNDTLSPCVTFDEPTQNATVYMVCAIVGGNYAASDSYHNIISKPISNDSTRVMIYGSGTGAGGRWEVRGSSSGSTSNPGVYPFGGKYVVVALRYSKDSAALTKGWLNTATLNPATAQVSANVLYFAADRRSSLTASQKLNRACDLDVKFLAIVNEAESDEVITQNINNLMEVFAI